MGARRGVSPLVPEPMRVHQSVIDACRLKIDSKTKAAVRRIVNRWWVWRDEIAEAGEGVQFGYSARLPKGSRLGHYCYIGSDFSSPSPVCVGDLCMLSTGLHIVSDDHGIKDPKLPTRLDFRWSHQVTVFEADVWIGHGAIIKSGVRIGMGAVVAAGSVVTKDVAPNTIVGGNPIRKIRDRFGEAEWRAYCRMLGLERTVG